MYRGMAVVAGSVLVIGGAILANIALEREDEGERYRRPIFNLDPASEPRLHPGPVVPRHRIGGPTELPAENSFQNNANAIAEGYHLFRWMNCDGCHGEGGGSIGPTLWDDSWIYGGSPAEIAESIIRGRPEGMPAFGGRLTEEQVWKIVAYLQDLAPSGGIGRAGDR